MGEITLDPISVQWGCGEGGSGLGAPFWPSRRFGGRWGGRRRLYPSDERAGRGASASCSRSSAYDDVQGALGDDVEPVARVALLDHRLPRRDGDALHHAEGRGVRYGR